jgi:cysteine desulfurase
LPVYLDHNATAPLSGHVKVAMTDWLSNSRGNPSSVHALGRQARAGIEQSRRQVAGTLEVDAREITFTSGATEAIDLGLSAFLQRDDHVVCSPVEHPAVYGALDAIGARVSIIPCDNMGRLNPKAFLDAVEPATKLAVVMAAQNELGNCYPIREIVQCLAPLPVFCDAVQAYGRMTVNVLQLGVAGVVISAHKIGGPTGTGALWLDGGYSVRPRIHGGPQERGRRAGTENVLGIIGLGAAVGALGQRQQDQVRQAALREELVAGLMDAMEKVIIHGDPEKHLANTLSFRIEGVDGDLVLQALDLAGVHISSGSACSSGGLEPSPTLLALGLSREQARGGLRVSIGPETSRDDVDIFLRTLYENVRRIRSTKTE